MATRIALVTGGSSGIGKACAEALANEGFHVILCGRRRSPLDQAASEISACGGTAEAVTCDVSRSVEVESLFTTIEERHGRLDLLFNNAGISAPAVLMDELPVEEWLRVVEINLTGAFLCTRAAFSLMRRQRPRGGRIINNGSVSAHAPRPFSAPYTATKHAITGLTKSTSLDGRAFDIACGQIDIGNAATDMVKPMQAGILQANGSLTAEPAFDVHRVGEAVAFMAKLPLDANVQFMTVMATKMPYIGRG